MADTKLTDDSGKVVTTWNNAGQVWDGPMLARVARGVKAPKGTGDYRLGALVNDDVRLSQPGKGSNTICVGRGLG